MPEPAIPQRTHGSISVRLTRRLLIALVILAFAAGQATYWQAKTALYAQFDSGLRVRAEALSAFLEHKRGHIEMDLSDKPQGNSGFVFEARALDGTLIEGSPELGVPVPAVLLQAISTMYLDLALTNGERGRAMSMRVQVPDEDHSASSAPKAVVIVASSREALLQTLSILQLIVAGSWLALVAAAFLIIPRILKRELAPLRKIAEEACGIDSSSLSARFQVGDAPDEITAIAARLNDLLSRLEASFMREREFTSDVAHEFRTPVAELRSFAELALKLPQERPANTDQEILNISLHLERMLSDLLVLARGEQKDLPTAVEPVDVSALLQDIGRHLQPRAQQRQLAVDLNSLDGATIMSDPILLRSILTNLLQNAVEYSPVGGRIAVQVQNGSAPFAVSVTNQTTDFTEQDLPKLFQRFWRKDLSRSADGHTGLGLALARAFAERLGCNLTASLSARGELTFCLESSR